MKTVMPRTVDPKITEQFLVGVSDVLDASVWWHEGDLRACVTVRDPDHISSRELQRECLENLGLHQTPREITMVQARGVPGYSSSSSLSRVSISARSSTSLRVA